MSLYIPKMSDTPGVTIPGLASNFQALDGSQIVEWGSNENGTYWRWENGLRICYGTKSLGVIPPRGTAEITWQYPITFTQKPYVFCTLGGAAFNEPYDFTYGAMRRDHTTMTTEQGVFKVKKIGSDFSGGTNVYLYLLAIGR